MLRPTARFAALLADGRLRAGDVAQEQASQALDAIWSSLQGPSAPHASTKHSGGLYLYSGESPHQSDNSAIVIFFFRMLKHFLSGCHLQQLAVISTLVDKLFSSITHPRRSQAPAAARRS